MPAACVIVAKPMLRARRAAIICQSSAKPADGGSKATGGLAIGRPHVPEGERRRHVRVLNGSAVMRDSRPDLVGRAVEVQRDQARVSRRAVTVADSGPSTSASPGTSDGGRVRSSVLVRKSPAPNTTAEKSDSSVDRERRPASRTSIGSPVRTCVPCRLAGSVAASFATTRSPGRRTSIRASRGDMAQAFARVDDEKLRVHTAAPFIAIASAIASSSSRAATSGRFKLERSASGTASACSGVSMSPGSIDRNRTP